MVRVIVIRHGYSVANKEAFFSGQMDVALDEVGYRQSDMVGKYVLENFKIDKVYASDLSRACNTVKPIADALGLEIIKRKDLREADVGEWHGLKIDDVVNHFPESFAKYKENPGESGFDGGETYAELQARMVAAINEIVAENECEEERTVVVGSHGGTIRSWLCYWLGIPLRELGKVPHVPNTSITVADFENGHVKFERIGFCGHLDEMSSSADELR